MTNARARLATVVLAGATLLGCGSPAPTAPAGPSAPPLLAGCMDLGDSVAAMSWSPGGQYLAVGTSDDAGNQRRSWLLAADGKLAGEVLTDVPGMELDNVVVGPDGRRAWLSDARDTPAQSLVEDQLLGRRVTPVDGPIIAIGWTQLGYAIVKRRQAGDAVLLLDPNNPREPPRAARRWRHDRSPVDLARRHGHSAHAPRRRQRGAVPYRGSDGDP